MAHPSSAGFERLGLRQGADARDIRRAYARELKKIDQAHDAAGFQALRAAYEVALQYGEPSEAVCPADAPEAAADSPPPQESPERLAAAVIEDFCMALAARAAWTGGVSRAACEEILRAALDDDRLLGIEARRSFERRLAALLVAGWRPGHEALLVVATAVFDWIDDKKLDNLGDAGVTLGQAFYERAAHDSHPAASEGAQQRVLALLRQEAPASDAQIAEHISALLSMDARMPNWLPIVGPQAVIGDWQDRFERGDIGEEIDTSLSTNAARFMTRAWQGAAIFMLCLMVLMVVSTKLKWFAPAAGVQDSGQRR